MLLLHSYYFKTVNPFMLMWLMFWVKTPMRSKRLFVLTSLYVWLSQCRDDDTKKLVRLNERFHLTHSSNNLHFPALMAKHVWRKRPHLRQVTLDTIEDEEHFVAMLSKRIPCWLWYADAETRHCDIRSLVRWTKNHL